MSLANTMDAWNAISGGNSASKFTPPSADSLGDMNFVDSSGFSFTPIAQGLSFGGSLFSAWGDYQQGEQIAGAYDYNADLARNAGQIQLDQLEREETILGSTQRAGYLKAGVTLSGSPLDVMMQSASQVELDKKINQYNTQSKVDMLHYQGEVAQNQAQFNMGKDLLSGGLGLLLGL